MTKNCKILTLVLLLIFPANEVLFDLFWVIHANYTLNSKIAIKLNIDNEISVGMDPTYYKTVTITNTQTKALLTFSYVSIESGLAFFTDTVHSPKTISIVDKFAGKNTYDYLTLELLNKKDCLKDFGGCGGYSDEGFMKLGKADVVFDGDIFRPDTALKQSN